MKLWDCQCTYRFLIGRTKVYGPIWPSGLPGHEQCYSQGRLMTRDEFEDQYADCDYKYKNRDKSASSP